MTKAWMVTSGSYSDYSVMAVFTTEERANDFVERVNSIGAGAEVEEIDLDPEGPPLGLLPFRVDITRTGDITRIFQSSHTKTDHHVLLETARNPAGWSIALFARDEGHAKKIATERRQQFLAEEALAMNKILQAATAETRGNTPDGPPCVQCGQRTMLQSWQNGVLVTMCAKCCIASAART